jgi:hypothetical protein
VTARASALSFIVLGAVLLAAHLSLAPRIAAVDSFYHIGHAAEYLSRGLFDTSFPWATQSVIRDLGADLWWGFHVVLVPFTLFDDPAMGIRVAAPILTLLLAAAFLYVLRRHAVPYSAWWTALFLLAVPNVLYRYLMVRPHVLSLGLALVLASVLVRGRWWQVFLVTAAMVWLHLSLFWMAPGVVGAYVLARLLARHPRGPTGAVPPVGAILAVTGGTALGWLARPAPLASARLAYVQIVQLFTEKAGERPLTFAVELDPLSLPELGRTSWFFLAVWIGAILVAALGARRPRGSTLPTEDTPRTTLLVLAILVSLAFGALTVFSARRALVEFVAFGCLSVPLAWAALGQRSRHRTALALSMLLVAHVPWAARRHMLNVDLVARPAHAMSDAANWLALNSEPGDVVFHARWDSFGPLFARNRMNYYLGGMDPIFQYAHDPGRYWEHFFLSADLVTEYTCDAFPCYEGKATGTHEAIRDHFGAAWALVEPARNPKLAQFLMEDPGFELRLQTASERIFRVLPRRAASSTLEPAP